MYCAGNTDRRDTVRATWGNVVWREKISALYNATYQILFIVGMLGYLMFLDLNGISYANTVAPTPNTADLGTDEIAAVFGKRRYLGIGGIGSHI